MSQPWVTEPTCFLSLGPIGGGEERRQYARHKLLSEPCARAHAAQTMDAGSVDTLNSPRRAQAGICSSSLWPKAPSSESYGFCPCFCHHPAAALSTHSPGPDQEPSGTSVPCSTSAPRGRAILWTPAPSTAPPGTERTLRKDRLPMNLCVIVNSNKLTPRYNLQNATEREFPHNLNINDCVILFSWQGTLNSTESFSPCYALYLNDSGCVLSKRSLKWNSQN